VDPRIRPHERIDGRLLAIFLSEHFDLPLSNPRRRLSRARQTRRSSE
jgi:hypothetical protein